MFGEFVWIHFEKLAGFSCEPEKLIQAGFLPHESRLLFASPVPTSLKSAIFLISRLQLVSLRFLYNMSSNKIEDTNLLNAPPDGLGLFLVYLLGRFPKFIYWRIYHC